MATIQLDAIGITKTATMPDQSLVEWAEAYGIPEKDNDGNSLSNPERLTLLWYALIERMKSQVERLRKNKSNFDASDIITSD